MRAVWTAAVLLSAAGAPAALAQAICATSSGTCAINGAPAPGQPCYCVTPRGPVQGTTQTAGSNPNVRPQFCCTPAGRFGPFPGQTAGPGQACLAQTPNGAAYGQACY